MDKPRKKLVVFTLKASAHALCTERQCNLGQRNGLSRNDITILQTLQVFMDRHAVRALSNLYRI